jgi:formate dehydrogenase iron-sulfur subunit
MSANTPPAKSLSRRQFFKLSAATVGASALAGVVQPAAASTGITPANTPAMLIDISRCIGCGNCQRSCNQVNGLHPTSEQSKELSSQTYTAVKRYDLEGGKTRFVKRQCMHCLDAACASACPVSALHKTAEGPIAYRVDRCLGCRYCMVSCPFEVPRFDWDNGITPEIRKCMFCIDRQRDGKLPACAENCPSGTLKFGTRGELLKEAHARLDANPRFYVNHIFGEHEAGGTAMLYISDVPFGLLGFRTDVTTRPIPAYTWDIMSKLPFVVGGLAVVLTGASVVTRRRNGHHDDTPPWERETGDRA